MELQVEDVTIKRGHWLAHGQRLRMKRWKRTLPACIISALAWIQDVGSVNDQHPFHHVQYTTTTWHQIA